MHVYRKLTSPCHCGSGRTYASCHFEGDKLRGAVELHTPSETIDSPRLAPYRRELDTVLLEMNARRLDVLEPAWKRFLSMLRSGGRLDEIRYPRAGIEALLRSFGDLPPKPFSVDGGKLLDTHAASILPDRWTVTALWRDLVFRELEVRGSKRDRKALLLGMTLLLLAEGQEGSLSTTLPYFVVFAIQVAEMTNGLVVLPGDDTDDSVLMHFFPVPLRRT